MSILLIFLFSSFIGYVIKLRSFNDYNSCNQASPTIEDIIVSLEELHFFTHYLT